MNIENTVHCKNHDVSWTQKKNGNKSPHECSNVHVAAVHQNGQKVRQKQHQDSNKTDVLDPLFSRQIDSFVKCVNVDEKV